MTADLTIVPDNHLAVHQGRLQAFLSSFVVTFGAGLATLLFVTLLIISLPLLLAASVTYDPKTRRRKGWQELQPVEA
ncbi:hypothetical protein NOG11_11640 [Parvularcula sp. BGMRC 0090]|uniref:Uncharacterized protein n=2 Tax=Parvularcula maris TaxID=2965077 RepID=A0A9X2LAL4_9PROT|nr:hypothetical protein [Parvularcula maris]